MNYRRALAALMIFGSMAVYAEDPAQKPATEKANPDVEKIIGEVEDKAPETKEGESGDKDGKSNESKSDENKDSDKSFHLKKKMKEELDPETKALQKKKKKLSMENTLRDERLKNDNADLLARLQKLRWEKDLISEQLELEDLKRAQKNRDEMIAYEDELEKLNRESSLAKAKSSKLESELAAKQTEWDLKTSRLNAEITALKVEKERDIYIDGKPVYLDNPLKNGDTLVISDRRIALNGPIVGKTADYITTRINYYNNKDSKKPIFIVIDSSPGGSVMAGYRILKAMEGSKSPVYVVVKSYAASMAATMLTLAKKSYAYPNAVILHHQISSTFFLTRMNLTQQKEFYEESKKWWDRLASPMAAKMGITTDEFIKQMYAHSSDGDWSEFASDARKLKWVDHIVNKIEETSLLTDPDSEIKKKEDKTTILAESLDKQGRPVMYLPRLSPKDMYFLYNPDKYYQLR